MERPIRAMLLSAAVAGFSSRYPETPLDDKLESKHVDNETWKD